MILNRQSPHCSGNAALCSSECSSQLAQVQAVSALLSQQAEVPCSAYQLACACASHTMLQQGGDQLLQGTLWQLICTLCRNTKRQNGWRWCLVVVSCGGGGGGSTAAEPLAAHQVREEEGRPLADMGCVHMHVERNQHPGSAHAPSTKSKHSFKKP